MRKSGLLKLFNEAGIPFILKKKNLFTTFKIAQNSTLGVRRYVDFMQIVRL